MNDEARLEALERDCLKLHKKFDIFAAHMQQMAERRLECLVLRKRMSALEDRFELSTRQNERHVTDAALKAIRANLDELVHVLMGDERFLEHAGNRFREVAMHKYGSETEARAIIERVRLARKQQAEMTSNFMKDVQFPDEKDGKIPSEFLEKAFREGMTLEQMFEWALFWIRHRIEYRGESLNCVPLVPYPKSAEPPEEEEHHAAPPKDEEEAEPADNKQQGADGTDSTVPELVPLLDQADGVTSDEERVMSLKEKMEGGDVPCRVRRQLSFDDGDERGEEKSDKEKLLEEGIACKEQMLAKLLQETSLAPEAEGEVEEQELAWGEIALPEDFEWYNDTIGMGEVFSEGIGRGIEAYQDYGGSIRQWITSALHEFTHTRVFLEIVEWITAVAGQIFKKDIGAEGEDSVDGVSPRPAAPQSLTPQQLIKAKNSLRRVTKRKLHQRSVLGNLFVQQEFKNRHLTVKQRSEAWIKWCNEQEKEGKVLNKERPSTDSRKQRVE